jgi:hypothetical protein
MALCPAKNDHLQKKTLSSLFRVDALGKLKKQAISFFPDPISATRNLARGIKHV